MLTEGGIEKERRVKIWWHWRILVKNIGGNEHILGEQKVLITDEIIGVSQLLGTRARAACPLPTPTSKPVEVGICLVYRYRMVV